MMRQNFFMALLFLLGILTSCDTNKTQPKTYVVCAGISDYQNIPSLRLPENDARSVSEIYEYQKRDVVLLLGREATKSAICQALRSQFSKAKPDDQVVFYFSGHGYQGGVCPYDISARDVRTSLSYQEIYSIMRESKAKQKIIIADACFSGGLRMGKKQDVRKKHDKSVVLFLSSRTGETSLENRLMQNGLFTASLVRGLRGGADTNADKRITAKEIFTFVSEGVQQRSRGKQHPVMWGSFDDDFVLMDWQ